MLPRVLILYTGGTFGMDVRSQKKGKGSLEVLKLSPALLRKKVRTHVPEIGDLAHCDIEIVVNKDSSHIGPKEWVLFGEKIRTSSKNYDGVVLLHGTDTLAYTASALSFLLAPCPCPVVITGAQRPLAAIRSDARRNLISAVEIAAKGPRPLVNQVSVFFDDYLFQGNRVRKRSATEFAAFESPKFPPLASVGTEIRYQNQPSARAPKARNGAQKTRFSHSFSERVGLLHLTAGFPARAIREKLLTSLDGLVLVSFASGTAPTHDPEFLLLLRQARELGIPIVITTEGTGGVVPQYVASDALFSEGCHWAGDMTLECAFVKTSLLLGQADGKRRFSSLWRQNLANEGA